MNGIMLGILMLSSLKAYAEAPITQEAVTVEETVTVEKTNLIPISSGSSNDFDPESTALLMIAARTGDLDAVKKQITRNADVNARAFPNLANGATALMCAAGTRHFLVMKFLLDMGAGVNLTAERDGITGITALMVAAHNGPLQNAEMLVSYGADINAVTGGRLAGNTALMSAASGDRPEVIKYLLSLGVDVNAQTDQGLTALMIASQKGSIESVTTLLESKAINLQIRDKNGKHALNYAFEQGHKDIVEALIKAGARFN